MNAKDFIGPKKPRKRPEKSRPFKLTPEVLQEIKLFGGHGITLENLRAYYGVKTTKFYKICEKHPEICEALFQGRVKMSLSIAGLLVEKARAGNVAAMIFYLKTQGRWVENHIVGLTDVVRDKIIPSNLGTDPIEASRIYQEIMK